MHPFKNKTVTWWQIALLKWGVLFIGIAIGATWPGVFARHALGLLIVGIALGLYVGALWLRRK